MIRPIELARCPKGWTEDLDKARPPRETVQALHDILANARLDVLAETRRIDTGRLDIPVFLSVCGKDASGVIPSRKQMGKGSSPAQAEASALMELMERFAFFTFWQDQGQFRECTWSEAERLFGDSLIPLQEILDSVHDSLDTETARQVMDLARWQFYPATRLIDGSIVWLPLDWFRMLGEFNGSSAGNTNAESLLQGLAELVERHVSARVATQQPMLPTIDPASVTDPTLKRLMDRFAANGICLVLKDISLGMPLPTVAALAWDPATFPSSSEIVFTAGTATTPAKAAIRAVTEVAQLAGDFCTSACYEASGLPKYRSLGDIAWLLEGPSASLASLPSIDRADILDELHEAVRRLAPVPVYAVETTHPGLKVPAHYTIAPGLEFRERDANQSLGLFAGRKLSELEEPDLAALKLGELARLLPDAPYHEFFQAMTHLRASRAQLAAPLFAKAAEKLADSSSRALAAFYAGYALTLQDEWVQAVPFLQQACGLDSDMRDYVSHLGVAYYKLGQFGEARACFDQALKLDKGSAMDLANRGVCNMKLGENAAARQDLEAALALDPGLAFARSRLENLEDA